MGTSGSLLLQPKEFMESLNAAEVILKAIEVVLRDTICSGVRPVTETRREGVGGFRVLLLVRRREKNEVRWSEVGLTKCPSAERV